VEVSRVGQSVDVVISDLHSASARLADAAQRLQDELSSVDDETKGLLGSGWKGDAASASAGRLAATPCPCQRRLPDGRIGVEFGPPAVAPELGLDGDQYTGWTGLFAPEELKDIRVEETRRA
jgi:hypothetical protein